MVCQDVALRAHSASARKAFAPQELARIFTPIFGMLALIA